MAYIVEFDNISPTLPTSKDVTSHVAYVKILDSSEANKLVDSVCISYANNGDDAFKKEIEAKIKSSIAKYEAKKAVEASVKAILPTIDMSKIATEATAKIVNEVTKT